MTKRYPIIPAMAIYILFFSWPVGAEPRHSLRINCTMHSPYEVFFFRLVEEIGSRNRLLIERNTPPTGRSLIHVNQGIDDGDGPRVAGLSSAYPNLICVPEPFGDFIFGAFAIDRNIRIDGWSSLADHNVAYIHGWKIFEDQITAAKSITRVKDAEQLFMLLHAGRADVALVTKTVGYAMMEKLNLKGIRFIEPPLAVKSNFLYLHKRHRDLVPKIQQTLLDLKRDGTYQRLYHEIIPPFPEK
ncbi:MAG: transporter substrate-binding domain-containing protein [Pseudomonadota bacterium]